jgi:hypothetical protein
VPDSSRRDFLKTSLALGAGLLAAGPVLGKGDRHLLPERPGGCFAQKVPVTFSDPPPGRQGDP